MISAVRTMAGAAAILGLGACSARTYNATIDAATTDVSADTTRTDARPALDGGADVLGTVDVPVAADVPIADAPGVDVAVVDVPVVDVPVIVDVPVVDVPMTSTPGFYGSFVGGAATGSTATIQLRGVFNWNAGVRASAGAITLEGWFR